MIVQNREIFHLFSCNAALYSRRKKHFNFDSINTITALSFRCPQHVDWTCGTVWRQGLELSEKYFRQNKRGLAELCRFQFFLRIVPCQKHLRQNGASPSLTFYMMISMNISKLYGIGKGDRIFYFTKSALEKEIKRASEKAGLQPIRVHDLRHGHASMLIELGFTPLEIADRLGHESVKTTLDTYSHLYPDKDQKLADRLNQFRKMPPAEEST